MGESTPKKIVGRVVQIVGPVIDVSFEDVAEGGVELPAIYDAIEIRRADGRKLLAEIQQHIGERSVRAVAMDSTDGLSRGVEAVSHYAPISMPVGEQIKGRLMNVVGDAIDGIGALDDKGALPIHREAPKFDDLTTSLEVLYTGIRVIDLLEP